MAILNGKYRVKNAQNGYDTVHLETSANQVKFEDGKTFQQKLEEGTLKGDKGDKGEQGVQGIQGERGQDGLTTSVTVNGIKHTHSNGNITIPDYPSTPASVGAEPANANIQAHISSNHAPVDAQKNSDITKEEIEAKLIGTISSHNHSDIYYDKNTVNEIVDNVSQELNEKIDSIKDSYASNISYTCDINTWVSESGLYKATVEHLLNTEKVVVNAYSNVTKESLFIHYRILSPTSIEIESSLNEDTKIIVINGEKEIQSIELDIPINDSELSGIKTWSSNKIKDYVDNATPKIPDFTASEIAYGKNECSNVDVALDKLFEEVSNLGGASGEMPVVSNVVLNNLTHSGTYDLTYTVTGGEEGAVYSHRLTIDGENHDFIPFKDGNTYTYHGTNLTAGKTQICRVFVSDGNRTSSSELFTVHVPQADVYGFSYNGSDTNPSTSITYIEGAVGLSGATATDLGGWEHRFPFNEIRPCGFKNGKVYKYIDKNNFKKYEDGTDVDTDVDVMIQFPRIYWNITKTSTGAEVRISPIKKEGYVCYAHNQNGNEKEFIYIGAYLSSSAYDSKTGVTSQSVTMTDKVFTNITNTKGNGYTIYTYHMNTMLQILFTLLYKTLNTREILGTVNTGANGLTDTLGMSGRLTTSNKFLGLQNICGTKLNFLAGATYELYVSGSSSSDTITNIHTNDTNVGISATYDGGHTKNTLNFKHGMYYSYDSYSYFNKVSWSNSAPFAPTGSYGGSNTTYFCSCFYKLACDTYDYDYSFLGFANYETLIGTKLCSIAGYDSAGHSTSSVSYRLAYI